MLINLGANRSAQTPLFLFSFSLSAGSPRSAWSLPSAAAGLVAASAKQNFLFVLILFKENFLKTGNYMAWTT
jgi:hypothetical protein